MIKIQGAVDRHPVIWRQGNFGRYSPNCPRYGRNDNLVQMADYVVPGQNQNGATLIRGSEGIPADFAPVQPIPSQPSASHASGSSSVENSSLRGGIAA